MEVWHENCTDGQVFPHNAASTDSASSVDVCEAGRQSCDYHIRKVRFCLQFVKIIKVATNFTTCLPF